MSRHRILDWTLRITGLLVAAFNLAFLMDVSLPASVRSLGNSLTIAFALAICLLAFAGRWILPSRGTEK